MGRSAQVPVDFGDLCVAYISDALGSKGRGDACGEYAPVLSLGPFLAFRGDMQPEVVIGDGLQGRDGAACTALLYRVSSLLNLA
jgi:hypothetical protein